FTLPIILWVPETRKPRTGDRVLERAFGNVRSTLKEARHKHKNLFKYLIAYLLYNDGIETAIVMSGVFAAQVLDMGQAEIVACFLMIQFVAFFGALIFGRLGDAFSNKRVLAWSLSLWALILLWAVFMRTKAEFWVAGVMIALVLGGSQALSRSLFGKLIPKGSEAQFYGFLSLSSKVSATMGPLAYGISRQVTGSPRIAILSLLLFFVLGQVILRGVDEPTA
ncbi:MAG: MFS transporter, partial [Elusimicrobiota bacterium]